MNRTVLNVQQGTSDWMKARAESDGTASEAPAMKSKSKYQTRTDLLNQRKTGLTKEVDSATQAIFQKGHDAEATARLIAEEIIGEELSPTTCLFEIKGLKLLASLDGIVFDDSVIFEHKLWNESLAQQVLSGELEEHYTIQMDQELLVSGANKCLFMVSDGTRNKCEFMWYESSQEKFDALIAGWHQFHKDLSVHEVEDVKQAPKAQAIIALPALAIQIKGEVTLSNLPEFKEAATAFITSINTELVSDEDFAQAEANVKFCKDAEDNIEATKKSAIAQTASIDELMRTLDFISDQLRVKRLDLDKKVKSEKENRRLEIVTKARIALGEHFTSLEREIHPIELRTTPTDFAGAIKGKKTLSSMQDAVNSVLANAKIELDATAKDIRAKREWLKANADGYQMLFADMNNIIYKPMDDLQVLVKSRIADHKQKEAEREAAIKDQAEADAKAKFEAEEAKAAADKAAADRIAGADKQIPDGDGIKNETINEADFMNHVVGVGTVGVLVSADTNGNVSSKIVPASDMYKSTKRPTMEELVNCVANAYKVEETIAYEWLHVTFAEKAKMLLK